MAKKESTSAGRLLGGLQEFGLILVILLLCVLLAYLGWSYAMPGHDNLFLNKYNIIEGIATPMSIYAIMAIGMTCVILTGGIDISVGSVMALAAIGGAVAIQEMPQDAPAWKVVPVAIGVPILIGLACGLFNGLLVVGLRVHSFIITLGTMSIIRCIAVVIPVEGTLPSAGKTLPTTFTPTLMRFSVWDVEIIPFIVTMAVTIVGGVFFTRMIAGRETYAVGGNEEAARFSGIRVERVKIRAFMISGLCAGIAGVVTLGRFGTVSSNTGNGYELVVVAGAVIGGANLAGGRGTALGALLGSLLMAIIDNGITFTGQSRYRLGFIGGTIIVAVALERVGQYFREKRTA